MADVLVASLERHVEEPHDVPGLLEERHHVLALRYHDSADAVCVHLQRDLFGALLRRVEPAEVLHADEVAQTDSQVRGPPDTRDWAAEAPGLEHGARQPAVQIDVEQGLVLGGDPRDAHLRVDDVDFAGFVQLVDAEGRLNRDELLQRPGYLD